MGPIYALWQLTAFVIGTCLGSFMALAIVRIPADESIVSPPSRCPTCHTRLPWTQNIPVLSWLQLRGRCSVCETPISPMYPLVEITMGLVTWLTFHRFIPHPEAMEFANIVAWVAFTGFAWCLLLAAYTDLRSRIIPEIASIYAVPFGLLTAITLDWLVYDGWLAIGWRSAVLGVLAGGGFLGLLSTVWYRLFGTEGLAWGDVRLMAMIGAFLGAVPGAWVVMVMASLLGVVFGVVALVISKRPGYLPFGPSLALSALAYMLFGDVVVRTLLPGMVPFL